MYNSIGDYMIQKKLLINILNFIDDNLYSNISINDLANVFHYNKDYIMRLFKKELKLTIIEYIQKKRIYHSLYYIENTSDSMLKISIKCGFHSQEYFTELFKRIIGISPRKFRKFSYRDFYGINYDVIVQDNLINLKNELDYIEQFKKQIIPKSKFVLSIFAQNKNTF